MFGAEVFMEEDLQDQGGRPLLSSVMCSVSSCLFSGVHIYSYLNDHLKEMAEDAKNLEELTTDLHVWPDFHGNRSPLADQSLKGMVGIRIYINLIF